MAWRLAAGFLWHRFLWLTVVGNVYRRPVNVQLIARECLSCVLRRARVRVAVVADWAAGVVRCNASLAAGLVQVPLVLEVPHFDERRGAWLGRDRRCRDSSHSIVADPRFFDPHGPRARVQRWHNIRSMLNARINCLMPGVSMIAFCRAVHGSVAWVRPRVPLLATAGLSHWAAWARHTRRRPARHTQRALCVTSDVACSLEGRHRQQHRRRRGARISQTDSLS